MTFAVYLEGWQMPIPIWTKSKGFHVIRYPLQQVLAVCLVFLLFHNIQGEPGILKYEFIH